jgi:hypothetical protein
MPVQRRVCGQGVWTRCLRRQLRHVSERLQLQRNRPVHAYLHAELRRQAMWLGRLRWQLRHLPRWLRLHPIQSMHAQLHAKLRRQAMRLGRLRWQLRYLPGWLQLQLERSMHAELHAELRRQAVRLEWVRWELRHVPNGLGLPRLERLHSGVYAELRGEVLWQRWLRWSLRNLCRRHHVLRRILRALQRQLSQPEPTVPPRCGLLHAERFGLLDLRTRELRWSPVRGDVRGHARGQRIPKARYSGLHVEADQHLLLPGRLHADQRL